MGSNLNDELEVANICSFSGNELEDSLSSPSATSAWARGTESAYLLATPLLWRYTVQCVPVNETCPRLGGLSGR